MDEKRSDGIAAARQGRQIRPPTASQRQAGDRGAGAEGERHHHVRYRAPTEAPASRRPTGCWLRRKSRVSLTLPVQSGLSSKLTCASVTAACPRASAGRFGCSPSDALWRFPASAPAVVVEPNGNLPLDRVAHVVISAVGIVAHSQLLTTIPTPTSAIPAHAHHSAPAARDAQSHCQVCATGVLFEQLGPTAHSLRMSDLVAVGLRYKF